MKEKQFRNKITWFVFGFSILVIWVHSYNAELFLGKTAEALVLDQIERFLGETIGQIAVPGFFMISGYLFYRNFTMDRLQAKWSSRIKTVLVPYLLWNGIYYLGYVLGSRLPFVEEIVGKGKIPFHVLALADALIHYTYNYVFWYLHQLILLILLAPVIYVAVKKRVTAVVAMSLLAAAIGMQKTLPLLNLDALLYYFVAAFVAVHEKTFAEGIWNRRRGAAGIALIAGGYLLEILRMPMANAGFSVLLRLMIPIGLWLLVPEWALPEAKEWMNNNFFIYAVHFAFVRLVNKTAAVLFFGNFFVPFLLYLVMPALVTAAAYWGALFLRKRMPPVWLVLTGGR
ncbi:MAG: acyltransferase family protein [Lachnospiraceae bacterium]